MAGGCFRGGPPHGPGASCLPPSTRNRLSLRRLGVSVPFLHPLGSLGAGGGLSFRLAFVRDPGQRSLADCSPTLPSFSSWEFALVLPLSLLLIPPSNCICSMLAPLTHSQGQLSSHLGLYRATSCSYPVSPLDAGNRK